MKKSRRYKTSHLLEDQYEPGSGGRVLRNLLGIKRKREMDRLEGQRQVCALDELLGAHDQNHRFNAADIKCVHRMWLSSIYSWAGQYRQVNITKGNFSFAAAQHIPTLMQEFERTYLFKFTPCDFKSESEICNALAIVHAELVLIHPFRDGNGRTARLLAILMAVQAGLPPLDFGGLKGVTREKYFAAVRDALDRNYEPMKQIFKLVIRRTTRKFLGT